MRSCATFPEVRVVHVPGYHEYHTALYAAVPEGKLSVSREPHDLRPEQALGLVEGTDVLHVGWPEYLLRTSESSREAHLSECLRFAEALGRTPVKIVWTMHNRLPHGWPLDDGRRLYRAWARIAHGVIHHSQWGMALVRSELPYRDDAVHLIIPHGHYGEQMPRVHTRAELERELQLPECGLRIGVIGRPQKTRGTALIMDAFAACRRDDLQLLVAAIEPGDPYPTDPRIIVRVRSQWHSREAIARQVHVCDALAAAHHGPTYLTSGVCADAIGAGIPMIVNQWPFFHEILGDAAVSFDGSAADLTRLFEQLSEQTLAPARAASCALQGLYTWRASATEHLSLYDRLGPACRE
jgi:hypothetical protein